MRRQIVAACLLQYIFVGEDDSEERGGRGITSFHFQSVRRGRSFSILSAASRGTTSRMAEAAAIRFRIHESDISIIFKCIKARDRSRWRMKKIEAAPTEEKKFVDTKRTEADGEKEEERKTERKRREERKKGRGRQRPRERERGGKERNE